MKLYEMNPEIESALMQAADPETGEIMDGWQDVIDGLMIAKEEKALNVGVAVRMKRAESKMIDTEIKRLQKMKQSADNHGDRLQSYLASNLEPGTKLKDHRVSLYWMHTKSVQIDEGVLLAEKYQRITVEPDKRAIKLALESDMEVDGARLVENDSLVVR